MPASVTVTSVSQTRWNGKISQYWSLIKAWSTSRRICGESGCRSAVV